LVLVLGLVNRRFKIYVFIIFAKKEFNFMGTVGFRPYDPSLFIFIIFLKKEGSKGVREAKLL
jgi:hypothetical protein